MATQKCFTQFTIIYAKFETVTARNVEGYLLTTEEMTMVKLSDRNLNELVVILAKGYENTTRTHFFVSHIKLVNSDTIKLCT